MIRVVLDANVFVSAIIKPDSNPGKIVDGIGQGFLKLIISEDILAEIKKVLLYPKIKKFHSLNAEQIKMSLAEIAESAIITPGEIEINGIRDDPQDNKYLECAVEGQADFIISGDHHLTDLKTFQGIRIIDPTNFLTEIARLAEK